MARTLRATTDNAAPYDFMVMAQLFPPAERVLDGCCHTAYDVSLLVEGPRSVPRSLTLSHSPNVRTVTQADCYTCTREAEFDQLPPRERIAVDEQWRVVHATGSGLLGWLVLTPRRHVMELADLTDSEARGLGDWQVRLARALTAELGAAKVYVAEFGEKPGFHLHFHVVPRAADLAVERRGPGCFDYLNQDTAGTVAADACDELALRLTARLAG